MTERLTTNTTYKWGEAPGEFKSQEDAQRAKTKQKAKSRRLRKGDPRNQAASLRATKALNRTVKFQDTRMGPKWTHMKWGNITRSIAAQLRSAGGKSGVPVRGGGKQPQPWKTEIPKKLTRNY